MLLFTGCGGANTESVQQLESEYENIREKADKGELSDQVLAKEYAKLFQSIAEGNNNQASEYATLLRAITYNECDFDDAEVFEVAESYAKVMGKWQMGLMTLGYKTLL